MALYDALAGLSGVRRFSEVGHAGIGYVTGANDFFHVRPTEAQFWGLPPQVLRVAVRKGEQLPPRQVDQRTVRSWLANDEAVLLLDLHGVGPLPARVREYPRDRRRQPGQRNLQMPQPQAVVRRAGREDSGRLSLLYERPGPGLGCQ